MKNLISIFLLFAAVSSLAQGAFDYVATASGTNTYTATIQVPSFPATYTGVEMRITFTNGNTGASTINITRVPGGAVGAAAIRKWDGDSFEPLVSGDIPAGEQITLRYTGSYFIMDSFGKGGGGGSGTVSLVSITPANGFNGVVTNATTTPAIEIETTVDGLIKGNGTAISAATAGTDYTSPSSTETQSNKSISLGSNTVTGTKSNFNTALTNGDFAYTDWPGVAKTANFQASLADAGTNCYHITSGSVTITFPTMTGLDGIQWGFYVEPAASAVFDFGAVSANGARHLPDSSLVYVRYDGIGNKFVVAGTNPVATGGGSVASVVAGNLIDVNATDPANPIVLVESGDKGDVTIGSNTLTIDNNAVTFAKMQAITDNRLLGSQGGTAVEELSLTANDFDLGSNTLSLDYTNGQAASTSNKGFLTSADYTEFNTETFIVACSDESTAITASTNKVTFRMPRARTLSAVRASLTTAQASGSIFTIDINENGTTILSTKITIDNTEKTSTTAVTAPVISDSSLADDSEITIDVDQIGASGATGLKVTLIWN